jgi:hypothetical protein
MECARIHFDGSLLGQEFEPVRTAVQAAVLQDLQALTQSATQTLAVLSEASTNPQFFDNPLASHDPTATTLARVYAATQAFSKVCVDIATTLDALAPLSVQLSSKSDNAPLLQAANVALMDAFDGAHRLLEETFKQVDAHVVNSQVYSGALRACMEVMQGLDAAFKDVEKTRFGQRDNVNRASIDTCGFHQAACTKVWEIRTLDCR